MTRYGMVIDLQRCIGCHTCTMSCKAANATQRGMVWGRVLKYETGKYPNSQLHFLPVLCMHCELPECEAVCPTGATQRREDGIVIIDEAQCIGCRYCMVACPYAARYFYDKTYYQYLQQATPYEAINQADRHTGTVMKCDFCHDRLEEGLEPACVIACPTGARYFGDLDDPQSEVSRLIREQEGFVLNPELGTNPSVYYLPDRIVRYNEVNS